MRESIGCFCNECFKCFKRNLIRYIIENDKINDDNIQELFGMIEKEIKKPRYNKTLETISEIPKLSTILLLSCNYYQGNNKIMNNIKKYFINQVKDSEYLLKWNKHSKVLMDLKYFPTFSEKLKSI